MAHLSLGLLGVLHIALDGVLVTGFESDKVRALLAYLALEAERPHRRAALAGLLWPERPERAAHLSLNQALSNLRRILGDRTAPVPMLRSTPETIQFDRTSDSDLDVMTFIDLLAACDGHPHRHVETCTSCARRLHQAVELYRGSLLDQFFLNDNTAFEEWALLQRERLHRLALGALARLAEYHERRGEFDQAQQCVLRLLELDPWREEAHRQLMRLLARSGQRSAALVQYATCRHVLAAELGVEPEEETTTLYNRIQRGEGMTAAQASATTNLAAHTALSPLIGRETELAQLADRLEQRDCRLLTLVGPGGIGKTRLALQAATNLSASFPDGVFFAPLAALTSAESLVPAIATALGFILHSSADLTAQLLAYLRTKDMLLVLDNFEQIHAGVDLLSDLLQAAPGVMLLATSREPLHLRVEWLMDVDGLPVPLDGAAGSVEQSSAVQLFVQTARHMQLDFALSPANSPSVVRICQLMAGTPLAIELAASWVRSLSCIGIAQTLEQSLESLATTMYDVPARHRSIRAVFNHSWRLLSVVEQIVLRRLSVFRGGMQADAAAQIADATPAVLAALVDKSLLRRNSAGRYDLHELVRQYASEQLGEAGEAEETRNQHAACYLALAEAAESHISGPDEVDWLNRLEVEHNNLRAALGWTFGQAVVDVGVRLATALWVFWIAHGHLREGREWCEAALAQSDGLPAAVRVNVLNGAAWLAAAQGDTLRAAMLHTESLALRRALGDMLGIADSLDSLGGIALSQGNPIRASVLIEEGLNLRRTLGAKPGIAESLHNLGEVARMNANAVQAAALFRESLGLNRELGDTHSIALSLQSLGHVVHQQGDDAQAVALFTESLTLSRQLGNQEYIAACLVGLARVLGARGAWNRPHSSVVQPSSCSTALAPALKAPIRSCMIRRLHAPMPSSITRPSRRPGPQGER